MEMEMEMARCVLVICGTMWSRGKGALGKGPEMLV